ncbi:MAG: SDR family oxidoreductase [Rhizobiales bacterium]|nr:SDR family oxidoreductase [Hyphomicrobiales bacterium]
MTSLFILGIGYSASEISRRAQNLGWAVAGTMRDAGKAKQLSATDVDVTVVSENDFPPDVSNKLANADHLLISVPPGEAGDPMIGAVTQIFATRKTHPARITYLSSLSVYGDFDGALIDEDAGTEPASKRGQVRVAAETAWQDLGARHNIPIDILRLAGIYGPDRNILLRLKAGKVKRISGTGHIFNRIHVADLSDIAIALMQRQDANGGVFNICDNFPTAQEDVIVFAAGLLGIEPPPATSLEKSGLSQLGRSFYEENKRVSNARMLAATGHTLIFPTYREGLTSLAKAINGRD